MKKSEESASSVLCKGRSSTKTLKQVAAIEAEIEKYSLLHQPMVDLDAISVEYGYVNGLKWSLDILTTSTDETDGKGGTG